MKSENLNFLETSGPLQACNGIALPLHPDTILVNNQLDALFSMYLFHFPTCFEQPSVHHQETKLYQYIICYVLVCVGNCLVSRSGPAYQTVTFQCDIYQMMY
jgi:hypothetical protein